jgi:hypothetical protein
MTAKIMIHFRPKSSKGLNLFLPGKDIAEIYIFAGCTMRRPHGPGLK